VTTSLRIPLAQVRPPCLAEPDRWSEARKDDAELKAICRTCPRRWLCAKEAVETPAAEGLWSGVFIPKAGRARKFALRQLASLATHGGYSVRFESA
jgi:WhiB family transcriptional regulator, redox-sensing transcriptional regulator